MEADIETQKNQDKVNNAIPAIYEMKTGATQRESVTCPRYDDEIISLPTFPDLLGGSRISPSFPDSRSCGKYPVCLKFNPTGRIYCDSKTNNNTYFHCYWKYKLFS